MGELELIEQIRSQWGAAGRAAAGAAGRKSHGLARGVALGIGDDCAILRPEATNSSSPPTLPSKDAISAATGTRRSRPVTGRWRAA